MIGTKDNNLLGKGRKMLYVIGFLTNNSNEKRKRKNYMRVGERKRERERGEEERELINTMEKPLNEQYCRAVLTKEEGII